AAAEEARGDGAADHLQPLPDALDGVARHAGHAGHGDAAVDVQRAELAQGEVRVTADVVDDGAGRDVRATAVRQENTTGEAAAAHGVTPRRGPCRRDTRRPCPGPPGGGDYRPGRPACAPRA